MSLNSDERPTRDGIDRDQSDLGGMAIAHSQACVVQGPVRENVEDRAFVDTLLTAGGMSLTVAIVADGVGGNAFGEIAAQDALDQIVAHITLSGASSAAEIPTMLRDALTHANQYVYGKSRQNRDYRGMATTAVMAAVFQNELYVANIGDSRVYLYDGGKEKLLQLTMDHSWANDVVRAGHYTMEEARKHPKADELNRSIGTKPEVEVDIGFYPEQNPGAAGPSSPPNYSPWPLKRGDRIVVCSDGLIKGQPQDESIPYVSDDEIIEAILTRDPQLAAEQMLNLALKRRVDDNASVIVLETAGSERRKPTTSRKTPVGMILAGLLMLLILVAAGLYFFVPGFTTSVNGLIGVGTGDNSPATAGIVTTETDDAPLSSPTAQVAAEEIAPTTESSTVEQAESSTESIPGDLPNGLIVSPADRISLVEDTGSEIVLKLADGNGSLVVESNQNRPVFVENGAGAKAGFDETNPNGLLGVVYDNSSNGVFVAHCLVGQCALFGETDQTKFMLPAGQSSGITSRGVFDTEEKPARNELFVAYSERVPEPTAVPEPTEAPTAIPTASPIPNSPSTQSQPRDATTEAPPPNPFDLDGDGVLHDPENELFDLCQDEVGTAGTCGCAPDNIPSACGSSGEPSETSPIDPPPLDDGDR